MLLIIPQPVRVEPQAAAAAPCFPLGVHLLPQLLWADRFGLTGCRPPLIHQALLDSAFVIYVVSAHHVLLISPVMSGVCLLGPRLSLVLFLVLGIVQSAHVSLWADEFLAIWQNLVGKWDYHPYWDLTNVVSFDHHRVEPRPDAFVAAAARRL